MWQFANGTAVQNQDRFELPRGFRIGPSRHGSDTTGSESDDEPGPPPSDLGPRRSPSQGPGSHGPASQKSPSNRSSEDSSVSSLNDNNTPQQDYEHAFTLYRAVLAELEEAGTPQNSPLSPRITRVLQILADLFPITRRLADPELYAGEHNQEQGRVVFRRLHGIYRQIERREG